MAAIPLNLIVWCWNEFRRMSSSNREAMLRLFDSQQPEVADYARMQDAEWFPQGNGKIAELSYFIWTVFYGAFRKRVPTVTNEHLARFLGQAIENIDILDAESEYKASEITATALMAHPQLHFTMFIFGEIVKGDEDQLNLVPVNYKASASHLDMIIRSFDAVTT